MKARQNAKTSPAASPKGSEATSSVEKDVELRMRWLRRSRRQRGAQPKPLAAKAMLVGDSGVGKSALVRLLAGQPIPLKHRPTVGVELSTRVLLVNGKRVNLSLFDFSGHDAYAAVRENIGGESDVVILVFDCTSRASFSSLDAWTRRALRAARAAKRERPPRFLVCATHADLEAMRHVEKDEGRSWAQRRGFRYFESPTAAAARGGSSQSAGDVWVDRMGVFAQACVEARLDPSSRPQQPLGGVSLGIDGDKTEIASMSAREMESFLRKHGVDPSNCLTKNDLLDEVAARLKRKEADTKQQEQAKRAKEAARKEEIRDEVIEEVQRWARGKSLRDMLNSIHGHGRQRNPNARPGTGTFQYLGADASVRTVMRAYRKALIRIHPDKVAFTDIEAHIRATETFKIVNSAYKRFKAAEDARDTNV